MKKMRSMILAATLALATLVAVPAFADGSDGARPSFPMPAATFKQHVDTRMAKAREHVEKRAAGLPADQAKELRARFDASVAKVNAAVASAVADGTVTKEEADAVRAASPRRGHGKCDHPKGGEKA
jgi:predicted trehalose synthase